MKKRWIILIAAALLALAVWCAWYVRPVSIHDLGPDMKPEIISVMLIRNGGGADIKIRACGWTVYLSCNFNAWSYLGYGHGVSLSPYVSHAHETARSLGDDLWDFTCKNKSGL